MSIAIIPARGGSKRIPRKNIKVFHGKPMIQWSIEAAIASQCFDEVVVSTDDEEIASVAMAAGAKVPFMRDAKLADDHATTTDVIIDTIRRLELIGYSTHYYCCIYATAPFLSADAISEGRNIIHSKELDFALSATSYAFPIQRAFKILPSGSIAMFHPEYRLTRSQDLDESYHDAGQFYWGTRDAWVEKRSVFSERCHPIILPRHQVQDIDTPEDWLLAEKLFHLYQQENN